MPEYYSNIEYRDMIFVYGMCFGNASAAAREYSQRFPERRPPDSRTIFQVFNRLGETGSVAPRPRGAIDRVDLQTDEEILSHFDDNPQTSTRRAANVLRTSHMKVHRTLTRNGRHPYHFTPQQHLLPRDFQPRVDYCNWLIAKCLDDPTFTSRILWTDEATFTREGIFNSHNLHVWSNENPRATRESHYQYLFKVNVWIGIIGRKILRPVIIEGPLNSGRFLDLLQNQLMELLEDVPLERRLSSWIQMDGCPAHNGREVRNWLDDHYPGRWLGRFGPTKWPARSPDLTPLDFYLWGKMKSIVYRETVDTKEELIGRIMACWEEMQRDTQEIGKVVMSTLRRARACLREEGRHFEHLI